MQLPKPIDFVRDDNQAYLARYQEGKLWYRVESSPDKFPLEFPVPIEETDTAAFLPQDRAMTFLKWITKHLKVLQTLTDEEKASGLYAAKP